MIPPLISLINWSPFTSFIGRRDLNDQIGKFAPAAGLFFVNFVVNHRVEIASL